jgi:uroporphyrinogen-III synthase
MQIVTAVVPDGASQIALIHHISSIVSSDLSLEKMLQKLISLTLEATRCDACLVYLVDRANNEVVLQASQLPHASEIGNIRLKIGEGITGWVAQHKSVVALSKRASADARFKTFQALPEDTRARAAHPHISSPKGNAP